MSVVPKSLRGISRMVFFRNAIEIMKQLTSWLLKEFGTRLTTRPYVSAVKDMADEDRQEIARIFRSYGVDPDKAFTNPYPQWFSESTKKLVLRLALSMVLEIVDANEIVPTRASEADERRMHQNNAISICSKLLIVLYAIGNSFPADLNILVDILGLVDDEIKYLKGWRKSDNGKWRFDR